MGQAKPIAAPSQHFQPISLSLLLFSLFLSLSRSIFSLARSLSVLSLFVAPRFPTRISLLSLLASLSLSLLSYPSLRFVARASRKISDEAFCARREDSAKNKPVGGGSG